MSEEETRARFEKNTAALTAQFLEDRSDFPRLGGLLMTGSGAEADFAGLCQARELLDMAGGVFDDTSDGLDVLLTAALAASPEPERKLYRLARAYRELRERFFPTRQLTLAALALERACREPADFGDAADNSKTLFLSLLRGEALPGGVADLPLCVLYAAAETEEGQIREKMRLCRQALSALVPSRRAAGSLASVCVLYPDPEAAGQSAGRLWRALGRAGLRPGRAAGALGALAGSPKPAETLAAQLGAMDGALKKTEGFGLWSTPARERLLFAALLTALDESRAAAAPGMTAAGEAALLQAAAARVTDPLPVPV